VVLVPRHAAAQAPRDPAADASPPSLRTLPPPPTSTTTSCHRLLITRAHAVAAVAGRRARLARAPQARLLRVRKAPAALHHIRGPVSSFNSRGYQTRIGRRYLSIPILRARSITCLVHSSMNLSRASAMHYSHSIILDLHLPAID